MSFTPIYKSDDPTFNHEAASAAYELVMKMDEDAARVFTEIVVSDAVEEIIEKNLRTVQRRVDEVVAKRTEMLKKALIRKAADDPEGALPYAQALSVIEKANPYDYGYVWQEKDFNRDPGTGRFRTKVTHAQKKPVKDDVQEALGIPKHSRHDSLKPEQKAKFQDEYRQLASFLGAVHESTRTPGDSKVALTFEDKQGNRSVKVIEGTRVNADVLEPEGADLVGVEAKPGALTVGGASFGLTHALGRGGVESVNAGTDGFGSFATSWNQSANNKNSNERTYGRIEAGSKFLGQVAPHSPKAQMAAAFGEFVGSMGPEAEKVIGPTARKTAYRYRGTEKQPDKRLVGAYAAAINHAKSSSIYDPQRKQAEMSVREARDAELRGRDPKRQPKAPVALAPSQMAANRVKNERRAPTWSEREDGRRTIAAYLKDRVPNKKLYGLQLASGNTPPSEGVMLNKDGQIVTQAVGYGDDHYLPFDLKNLRHLKGGEYIRTRSVGGLTSEDIYTGLISGARQVTVVSRSGTFTLTFDEDMKGGRRHNDKARRMTRRYEQILDAVQSEQVDKPGNIRDDIKMMIIDEVETELGGYASPRDKRALIKQRIDEYKSDPELTELDERLISTLANRKRADGTSADAKDYVKQVTAEILADKHLRYRLDGNGYQDALKALEEQFPYYITVKSRVEDEHDVADATIDRGYVEPGHNRPTAAAAGLFGARHRQRYSSGNKFSASEADYQGATSGPRGGSGAPTPAPAAGGGGTATQTKVAEKTETKTVGTDYLPAAATIAAEISAEVQIEGEADKALLAAAQDGTITQDPTKQAAFHELVTRAHEKKPLTSYTSFRNASGQYGLKPYHAGLRGAIASEPFAFEGPAFEGKNMDAKRAEMAKIDAVMPSSLLSKKKLSEMSDSELIAERNAVMKIYGTVTAEGLQDPRVSAKALMDLGVDREAPAVAMLVNARDKGAKAGEYLDQIHRMRAVIHGLTDDDRKPPVVVHSGTGVKQAAPETTDTKNVAYAADLLHYAAEDLSNKGDHERANKLYEVVQELGNPPGNRAEADAAASVLRHYGPLINETHKVYAERFHQNRAKNG